MNPRHHIYGIDFSGAKDAGKKIWIAKGIVKWETLLIEDCFRARKHRYQENICGNGDAGKAPVKTGME